MAFLTLDKVDKRFGEQHTIKGVDLAIEKGEFIVFVGPSGCGKSTLLRLIAGLTDVDGGRITLDGRDITALHSSQRDLAMVFQSYALYPHMSVFDNMSFALRLAKAPRTVIEEKVQRAAEILNLKPYLQRTPRELSGGQRQRVAIGRAIVRAPKVFLFDEPLSNLDAALRGQTRIEIHKLHTDLNATTIYVTHDQVEAMTLADRVVVLRDGAIEQVGSPLELYDRPANTFVAQFIGTPAMNVLAAGAVPSFARLTGGRVPADGFIGLRPEALSVTAAASAGGASGAVAAGDALPGRLELVEELGAETNLYVQMAAPDGAARISLVARGAKRTPLRPGDAVQVRADPALLHLFDGRGVALH